uniref:G_PROTEIN_RECEP_F1_2 domain-containing protein n=1 Tax=Panagrellus redivivus TaxID=6233 RepID=A0A7E4VK37_PANRE
MDAFHIALDRWTVMSWLWARGIPTMVQNSKQDKVLAKAAAKFAKSEVERVENEIMTRMAKQNAIKFMMISNAENAEFRRRFNEKFAVAALIVVLIPFIMIAFNCAYDKPFIPKSQGFCDDAVHLFTKYELRKTFRMNYRLTITNLRAFVIGSATSYFVDTFKSFSDNLQKYGGNCYVKTNNNNETICPKLSNFSELISNVCKNPILREKRKQHNPYAIV